MLEAKMQGSKTRLDQIYPSRKASSTALVAPKLDSSPSARKEKRKENPAVEVSPSKKGSLEGFLVRSKSSDNHSIGAGERLQDGGSGHYVRQSTWPKPSSCVTGPNSTDSWLQGCGPHVSKFVPRRLLETEPGNGSPIASPVSSQPEVVGSPSDSAPRGHLTQFVEDFLPNFVSGLAKPSGATYKKRAFEAAPPTSSERMKKHRHIDGREEDVISCTQHYLTADLSANDELGSIKEEMSAGLLKSFKGDSIRRGLSGLPSMSTSKEFAQLELTPGGGVARCGADTDLMSSIVGKEAPVNATADVLGIRSEGLDKEVPQSEGGSMLPPACKTPEDGRPRRNWGGRVRGSKSKSRSRSKDSLSTPTRSSKVSEGWQYHSSMFSPGDTFWDEAIEAVDGLFLPIVPPKPSSIRKSLLSSAGRTAHAVNGETCKGRNEAPDVTEEVEVNLASEESPAENSIVNLDGRTSSERVFKKRFDEAEISPLPVRRFSFTCQQSPTSKSVVKSEGDEIPNASPVSSQFPLGEEPLDVKEILSADQAISVANVDVTGVSSKIQVGPDLQPKAEAVAVDPVKIHATSTLLEPAPGTSAEPSTSGQICAYALPSAGENSEAIVAGAIIPIVDVNEPAFTSTSVKNTSLELSDWLPPEACVMYSKKGLKRLYPWQVECLQLDGVLDGRSLVYCASTSAGKSLVAEVLMIRRVLSTGKKALLVLPYVALCAEKADHLDAILEPLGKRVRGFYGSQGGSSLTKDTAIAVCTIEKANSLVNKLLEEGRLSEIAILVIDELHMVGDRDRGYLLELLLTKLRYAAGGGECHNGESSPKALSACGRSGMQIVGMSATMPNVSDVATWLEAALYQTEFRPVPLEEFMKVGNKIYSNKMEVVRSIRKNADLGGKDPDHLVELCHEVVKEGHSVLVFCPSRKGCETSARHISKFLPPFDVVERDQMTGPRDGNAAVEQLRRCPAGLDPVLEVTVPAGVAYHHAGLTGDERDVIETCFKSGVVRVLVATSTLAAGVNLPARRVIFRQPKIGRDFLDATRYRQMAGRAGRAGIDTKGESVLICKPEEVKRMEGMMKQDCPPLQSCLADDKNGMVRALLEVVAGGVVQSAVDVQRYVRCTLLNATQPFEEVVKAAQESLRWLCHKHFVAWDESSRLYASTPLGRAAFSSSLSPEESLVVFEDLAKARESFVLASDLHLLYEITPTYVELEPDWGVYYSRFMELSPIDQVVGNRVGVVEPFLLRMAHGAPVIQGGNGRTRGSKFSKGKISPPFQKSKFNGPGSPLSAEQMLRVCKRFYVALVLSKLIQEVPLMEVCDLFKVPRGTVQGLQDSAGRFSGMVGSFCERLGWSDLEGLVSKFQKRISFGVKSEIVELTEIPFVKAARARALFKAGLRSVQAIAEATLPEIVKALYGNISWAGPGANKGQQWLQMGIARKINMGARRIALDRAEEARAAAFSAYEALGVQVPAALAKPIVDSLAIDEVDAQVAPAITLNSMMEALHVGTELKVAEVPAIGTDVEGCAKSSTYLSGAPSSPRKDILEKEADMSPQKPESVPSFRVPKQVSSSPVAEASMLENADDKHVISREPFQTLKSTDSVPAKGALFTGSLIAQQELSVDDTTDDQVMVLTRGPLDVDKLAGGFDEFLAKWRLVDEFAFDMHVNSQISGVPGLFDIMGVAVCWKDSPVYYVSFSIVRKATSRNAGAENPVVETETAIIESQTRWRHVDDMLSKSGVRKISWDLKVQFQALSSPGLHVPSVKAEIERGLHDDKAKDGQLVALPPLKLLGPFIDLRVAAWLLWPDEESARPLSLEQEVKRRLPGETVVAAGRAGRWPNQMGGVAHDGCCRRVAQEWVLHCAFWKLLVAEGLHDALLKLEMPLVKVLADMETWGLGVDMRVCRQAKSLLRRKLRELESQGKKLAGMSFSLSAPAEVAHVLYRHLKLPVPPGCKGKHHPSTDKQALDFLRNHHPIADLIKEHRSLSKLLSGTLGSVVAWSKSPESCVGSQSDRVIRGDLFIIYGTWLQTSTATGRLSMEEPNLQCVEHAVSFSIGDGSSSDEATKEMVEVNVRQAFVPSQEGWVLLTADYSQIEVRLMAHFSGDPTLVSLLTQPKGDLFRVLASQWTGLSECEVSEEKREHTKRLVYGIIYGMGVSTLSEHLQCPYAEAQDMVDRFKATFPLVNAWLTQSVKSCRENGYIKTLSGRKRYLDKINTGKWGEQAKAERQAVNSICQGSAADLIKLAMIKVHDAISTSAGSLDQNARPGSSSWHFRGSCRLLLQIHDELVLEVDKRVLKDVAQMLRASMEEAATLKVPLRANLRVGASWGSLQPYAGI